MSKEKIMKFVTGVLTSLATHILAIWLLIASKSLAYYAGHLFGIFFIELGA